MSISNGKRSVVLSDALRANLRPLCEVIATATGKVWDAARDAFVIALSDFPEPKDAATAVRKVITDDLKANPGTARSYLSQLVKLAEKGEDVSKLSMMQATSILYPAKAPAPKPSDPGYVQYHAAKAEAAAKAQAEADAEAAKDPRKALMRAIASDLAKLDETGLALIAPEISRLVGELVGTESVEVEADDEARAA